MTGPVSCVFAAGEMIGSRSEQQDAFGAGTITLDDGTAATLVVLADGMGGETGGRLASRIAVTSFLDAAQDGRAPDVALRLREALLAANLGIADRAASEPALSGMGCTLIGLAFARGRATWVSVGDSLILRLTEEGAIRINADHSMAPAIDEAVVRGEMSPAEARSHPQRSVLLAALTGRPLALIDEQSVELRGEERFILASDGLLTLDREAISRIAAETRAAPPEALVSALLAAVEAAAVPDQDNCMIVAVRAPGREAKTAPSKAGWAGILLLVAGVAALTAAATILLRDLSRPGRAPAATAGPEARPPVGGRRDGIIVPETMKVASPKRAASVPKAKAPEKDKAKQDGTSTPAAKAAATPAKDGPASPALKALAPAKAGKEKLPLDGTRTSATPPPRNVRPLSTSDRTDSAKASDR